MSENKSRYCLPSEYAEKVQLAYAKSSTDKHKKDKGQFFTSRTIANFMGGLARPKSEKIYVLDPGCGTGILSCSLIENLVKENKIKEIKLKLFEIDGDLITETKKVISFLKRWLVEKDIELNVSIEQKDFILSNLEVFTSNTLFSNPIVEKYDYIISNPPYFKLSKLDKRAKAAKELVYGQPNIYSIFMGFSAKLLGPDGELIFITPRSFTSGNYFKAFRKSFFQDVKISDIHIFESRKKMFKNDNILQENIIIRATKKTNTNIKVTVSNGENDLNKPKATKFKTEDLIDLNSNEKILFIPSNYKEAKTISFFKRWHNSLSDYNIKISTGPVVPFRCKNFLVSDYTKDIQLVPLLWLHNIKEMNFLFPLKKRAKPSYIVDSLQSQKLLLKNKNYVLIRRFSSKDDKSRLVCSPYYASSTGTERIGIENHLNYVYRPHGELCDNEIWGISALFNSTLYDTYFRTFNGNTQVGIYELKLMKIPPIEQIILIGTKIKKTVRVQREEIDNIVNEVLLGKHYVKNKRITRNIVRTGITECSAQ